MKHCFRFLGSYKKTDSGFLWKITESELHHLHSVLRLKEGDIIEVFNGNGFYSLATIESINPKKEALAQSEQLCFAEKSERTLALAIGSLKPKTLDDLLPCLVELGLNEIHVFSQKHTEKFRLSDKSYERAEKIILAATKQSKRNYTTQLIFWQKTEDFTKHLREHFNQVLVLTPEAKQDLSQEKITAQKICAVIGSESGLSEEELKNLKELGAKEVKLGKSILRAYTAAIATSTLLSSL